MQNSRKNDVSVNLHVYWRFVVIDCFSILIPDLTVYTLLILIDGCAMQNI